MKNLQDRAVRWALLGTLILIVICTLLGVSASAMDAPAPAPSPAARPRPVASPSPVAVASPVPFDLPPVDAPGEAQPDSPAPLVPVAVAVPVKIKPSWWPVFDLTKWTLQVDGGMQTVMLHEGENREYATGALEFAGPLSGFDIWQRTELLGEQDGGRLNFTNPQSFRAVLVDAKISRTTGTVFAFAIKGGTTFSVEGGQFAPIDPRLWTLQGEASLKLSRLILSGYGGHDGALGGYAIGGSVAIPVMGGRPQLLTSFDYPISFDKTRPSSSLPWQFKAGARIIIVKEFLSDLF